MNTINQGSILNKVKPVPILVVSTLMFCSHFVCFPTVEYVMIGCFLFMTSQIIIKKVPVETKFCMWKLELFISKGKSKTQLRNCMLESMCKRRKHNVLEYQTNVSGWKFTLHLYLFLSVSLRESHKQNKQKDLTNRNCTLLYEYERNERKIIPKITLQRHHAIYTCYKYLHQINKCFDFS